VGNSVWVADFHASALARIDTDLNRVVQTNRKIMGAHARTDDHRMGPQAGLVRQVTGRVVT
jgi:hypothetical protein